MFVEALGKEVITAAFLEGPLLVLTQSAGAERVFMDMVNNKSAVHHGLDLITKYDEEMVKAFARLNGKPAGFVWDYLWGNYSCLGDKEYEEFEGHAKYADKLNKLVADKVGRPTASTTAPTCPTWTARSRPSSRPSTPWPTTR